jgi:Na+/proline symporter
MDPKIIWLFILVAFYWSYCVFYGIKQTFTEERMSSSPVADNPIPLWVFTLAATATSFSGWTFIGHPGLLYREGFPYGYAAFYAILIPFTGVLLVKRQWLIGRHFGFSTPSEMFASYFQSNIMRLCVILVALMFSIPYLSVQLRAAGFLFNVLTDGLLGIDDGMMMLAFVLLVYVAFGGLKSAIYVDTLQLFLLIAGIVLLGGIVLYFVGGVDKFRMGIAALVSSDPIRTPEGYSHYVAVPGLSQWVSRGEAAVGGAWTSSMIFTYLLGMMGIQASPAFSMWALSNRNPKIFAPQQVWASSLVVGLVLVVFSAILGIGGHFLGADLIFLTQHPELVNNVMSAGLLGKDLMDSPAQSEMLVPQLIYIVGDYAPWLLAILAVCALAAMQSTASAYLSTAGNMLTHDVLQYYFLRKASPTQQRIVGRLGVVLITLASLALAMQTTDALVLLGGGAVAYGLQMYPALLGLCWWRWLTRAGVITGLIAGIITVTLTEAWGVYFTSWGRWPLTIHAAGWGIAVNFTCAVLISALTQNAEQTAHRQGFHQFLQDNLRLPEVKRAWIPWAWFASLTWFLLAIGPGTMIGNTIFGHPDQPQTWWFGIPSIWTWQILFWLLGIALMQFLAYKMELSTVSEKTLNLLKQEHLV